MNENTSGKVYVTMKQKKYIDSLKVHPRVPTYEIVEELIEKAKAYDVIVEAENNDMG